MARSPDDYEATGGKAPYPKFQAKGSFCASGELVPPSALEAYHNGVFGFPWGCWPSCPYGSATYEGQSQGTRCYGMYQPGKPQVVDHDPTDTTVACHCE